MSKDNKYIVIGFDESIKVLDFDTNSLYHYFENQDLSNKVFLDDPLMLFIRCNYFVRDLQQ